MELDHTYIKELKDNLAELDPYLVLLFGSFAYGSPHSDSDLDIIVVLNDNSIPSSFTEKQALYLKVSPLTRSVAKEVPIDLIVYTRPMFENFMKAESAFSKEILEKGVVLYESKHPAVA
jgi:predicted nucleotidyltransferase